MASSVLELGCGAGVPVAAGVLASGHAYLGIDVSPRQIDLARGLVPDGDFRCGDVLDQSFDDASFDAVIAFYVVTHVPRELWAGLFASIHRWLRPGGLLALNVPDRDSPGWLEQDFLGLGTTNWTNAYGAAATQEILAAHAFEVLEAKALADDDDSPDPWVWITARRRPGQRRS